MQEVEIDSTDIALALIDMLYDQGTIDAHLYNRIKAKIRRLSSLMRADLSAYS